MCKLANWLGGAYDIQPKTDLTLTMINVGWCRGTRPNKVVLCNIELLGFLRQPNLRAIKHLNFE